MERAQNRTVGGGTVLVQSPLVSLQSTSLAPPPTWPWFCLALPLQEGISSHCLGSPGPSCSLLLTLKCSGRGHPSAKQTSGTRICDSVLIIGAIWLLSGSFTRRQGFLGVGLRPAWLLWLCLIALACPGCLLRMWHGECRGAPSDRQPGPPAESPAPQLLSWQAGWGLSGGSQRGCFGTWRTFGRLRARALE